MSKLNVINYQWYIRDHNLRDRDLAETSRPRLRLCHKSRDRDLKARDRDSRTHISLMEIKARSLKNAAKIFEMLPNTKINVFAVDSVALMQATLVCSLSEETFTHVHTVQLVLNVCRLNWIAHDDTFLMCSMCVGNEKH